MDEAIIADFLPKAHDHDRCVAEALRSAESLCAKRKLRLTPLRRRVLALIWGGHKPIGAYEILDTLRKDGRRAAPPTVYRTLDFLLAHGLVHRLETLNAYVGCGAPGDRHSGQFLICRDCRSIAELNDAEIARALGHAASAVGFRVHRQTIEILGTCPDCNGRSWPS